MEKRPWISRRVKCSIWRAWGEEGEGKNVSRQLYQREKSTIKIKDPIQMLSYVVWSLFLIVKLSKFGAKYNQRMEGTPGREFFAWFEVNESTFSPDL